jgi:hypothetical protein
LVFETRGLQTSPFKGAGVGVVFHGSDGYVVLTSYDTGAAFDKEGKMVTQFKGGGDHFGNFINAVRSRKREELAADIQEGHLSSALCHLGNISYRLGSKVSFKEAQERLAAFKSNDDSVETFERFKSHLVENKVDLDSTQLTLGLHLAVDGKGEKFQGEGADKANPMLTREYRAPFVVPTAANI